MIIYISKQCGFGGASSFSLRLCSLRTIVLALAREGCDAAAQVEDVRDARQHLLCVVCNIHNR